MGTKKEYDELVSYAQNQEDMVLHALLHKIKNGFYVDVGANHETLHSVTKFFYDRGWNGINIDPNVGLMREFKDRKRDINLTVGISDKKGSMKFREYPNHDGFSTLSSDIKDLRASQDIPFKDYDIEVTTLKSIFKKHKVRDIAFLKVDVEGFEPEVLESNNWEKYRPVVVTFEGTYIQRCRDFLIEKGYHEVYFDGLNIYMVADERSDITMSDYSNVLLSHGFKMISEKRLEDELEALKQSAAQEIEHLKQQLATIPSVRKAVKTTLISLKRSLRARTAALIKLPTTSPLDESND